MGQRRGRSAIAPEASCSARPPQAHPVMAATFHYFPLASNSLRLPTPPSLYPPSSTRLSDSPLFLEGLPLTPASPSVPPVPQADRPRTLRKKQLPVHSFCLQSATSVKHLALLASPGQPGREGYPWVTTHRGPSPGLEIVEDEKMLLNCGSERAQAGGWGSRVSLSQKKMTAQASPQGVHASPSPDLHSRPREGLSCFHFAGEKCRLAAVDKDVVAAGYTPRQPHLVPVCEV